MHSVDTYAPVALTVILLVMVLLFVPDIVQAIRRKRR